MVFVLSLLLLTFFFPVFSADNFSCAEFKFPDLTDTSVSRLEHSSFTLNFFLQESPWCFQEMFDSYTIEVSQTPVNSGTESIYCRIHHRNGECIPASAANSFCECEEKGQYRFSKKLDRKDIGNWIWRTVGLETDDVHVFIDVHYAAKITDLKLPQKMYNQGRTVDITCRWVNGNPPVTARLLDRHGVQVKNSNDSGWIRYTFPAVGCQDAGLIRCEAPGASHNKSATLLVKCTPHILLNQHEIVKVELNSSLDLSVPVRSHTRKLSNCRLGRLQSDGTIENQLCNQKSLTGTPPDLTLTVRLDNVTKEEEGQWRLELTNDAGTGHVNFFLQTIMVPEDDGLSPLVLTLGGAGAVIVFVSFVCAAVFVFCQRRTTPAQRPPGAVGQNTGSDGGPLPTNDTSERKPSLPYDRGNYTSTYFLYDNDNVCPTYDNDAELELGSQRPQLRPERLYSDGYLRADGPWGYEYMNSTVANP